MKTTERVQQDINEFVDKIFELRSLPPGHPDFSEGKVLYFQGRLDYARELIHELIKAGTAIPITQH